MLSFTAIVALILHDGNDGKGVVCKANLGARSGSSQAFGTSPGAAPRLGQAGRRQRERARPWADRLRARSCQFCGDDRSKGHVALLSEPMMHDAAIAPDNNARW